MCAYRHVNEAALARGDLNRKKKNLNLFCPQVTGPERLFYTKEVREGTQPAKGEFGNATNAC